jgi:hypothetical protein
MPASAWFERRPKRNCTFETTGETGCVQHLYKRATHRQQQT